MGWFERLRHVRLERAWRSLPFQWFAITVLPLTLLLLVVTFTSLWLHENAMRSMVGERDERAVNAAVAALEAELQQRENAIQGLALHLEGRPQGELFNWLSGSSYLEADFDGGLAVLTGEGVLLAASGDERIWGNAEVLAMARLSGEKVVRKIPLILVDGTPMVVLMASISHSEEPEGLSWMAAGAFSARGLAEGVLTDLFPDDGHTAVYVMDRSCRLVYLSGHEMISESFCDHPGARQALTGESGSVYVDDGSIERVVAYSPAPALEWVVFTEEPWEMVTGRTLQMTQLAPLTLAPVLVVVTLALWFGARQIVRPLQRLEALAARLAWGDFDAIQEPVGGISEIRHLQDELVQMSQKVWSAQQSLHSYIGAITRGQEDERRRLARELHDETLQSLIALKQRIQLTRLAAKDETQIAALDNLEVLGEQAIRELRLLTHALRPIYLEDLGLVAALGALAQETSQRAGLAVKFQLRGVERRLSPEVELALYRMAQELLSNIVRHAQAASAFVCLQYDPAQVTLEVQDDGVGFVPPARPTEFAHQGHYGLLGLHERAELIGARLEILSEPGKGSVMRVRLADVL